MILIDHIPLKFWVHRTKNCQWQPNFWLDQDVMKNFVVEDVIPAQLGFTGVVD
jgi:hypothetical protein